MNKTGFITATGIWYRNEIKTIKKKTDVPLQPVYEAFMNAWEAILDNFSLKDLKNGVINISIHHSKNLMSQETGDYDFDKMVISDNGIGLNDKCYKRLINLRDDTKQHSNLGTGRIQFIHFFENTTIDSIYKEGKRFKRRKVTLSKNEAFLKENAIMRLDESEISEATNTSTEVTFKNIIDVKDNEYYSRLTIQNLKDEIIKHYLSLFCEHKGELPKIHISLVENMEVKEEVDIISSDIPNPDKEEKIFIDYSKLNDNNKIVSAGKQEEFQLTAFKRSSSEISQNAIYLVSKGAIGVSIDIESLQKKDEIDGNRYMFLLTGKYLNESDRDDRGNIRLISAKEFKQQNEDNLFKEEVVLYDNIVEETNKSINKIYTELDLKNQEKNKTLDELQQMFLLNPITVDKVRKKIKNTDSEETILKEIYKADSEIEAKKDDAIRKQIEEIKFITPDKTEDYLNKLKEKVDELIISIPLQNRTVLSKYVARRKLVLDLFEQILNRELESLKKEKEIDEKILHNLIFQQSSTSESPEGSDLWLLNEEYIYFKGISDVMLKNVQIEGHSLFKENMSDEELEYKNKCGKDAGRRRPDILLFPKEGKCIIIEFKAPHVDVASHLDQINRYARLINNLSDEKLKFSTYYGYLVGEQGIDIDEIQDSNPDFQTSHDLDYLYRPYFRVLGKFGRRDGSLYTEIIKYSDILQRAKQRNKIFIEKLMNGDSPKSK